MSERILTRDQVKKLVSIGHVLVMYRKDNKLIVLRLNNFLDKHPGMALPVLHFAGRDASDEIDAYHPAYALKMMNAFTVGVVAPQDWSLTKDWVPVMPPLHASKGWPTDAASFKVVPSVTKSLAELQANKGQVPETWVKGPLYCDPESLEPPVPTVDPAQQKQITNSFRALRKELEETGVFEIGRLHVFTTQFLRVGGLLIAFMLSFYFARNWWQTMFSAVMLGAFWHQAMFLAHDAGHTEITGCQTKDKLIGGFIASWMMGMSLGWWSDQHNTHHLVPNHPEHDPDIQLLPFLAFSEKALEGVDSTYHRDNITPSKATLLLVSLQDFVFYPLMIFARFSLLGKSYHYIATKAPNAWFKKYEISGIVFFYAWYSACLYTIDAGSPIKSWALRAAFVLTSLATTCPIHVQIVLSHSAQSSEDIGPYESFAARQLRTTMDVSCPRWLDWFHGGLHQQIAHHLFPRCPRPLLREVSKKVQAWADRTEGVTFESRGFASSNFKIRTMLSDIAQQASVLRGVALQIKDGTLHMD